MAATESSTRAMAALDDLYRRHVGDVYRYTYAVLGNHADAEDVTQTTFVNALRALERGERPREASHWLLAIAHNIVRQRWRQQASRPAMVELAHDVPHEATEEEYELDELVRALQRIPPSQREALVMRELEGRSYKEISELLGLTTGALETLLFRARRSLAEELENVVTCQTAERMLSRQSDGRISRKERKRLEAHLAECQACTRFAKTQAWQRKAFKGLAVLPVPVGLALFKGAPAATASTFGTLGVAGSTGTAAGGGSGSGAAGGAAAAGSVSVGGTVAGGSLLGGVAIKIAAVVAAASVAIGVGYQGVNAFRDAPTPAAPGADARAAATPTQRAGQAAGIPTAAATTSTRDAAAPVPAESSGSAATGTKGAPTEDGEVTGVVPPGSRPASAGSATQTGDGPGQGDGSSTGSASGPETPAAGPPGAGTPPTGDAGSAASAPTPPASEAPASPGSEPGASPTTQPGGSAPSAASKKPLKGKGKAWGKARGTAKGKAKGRTEPTPRSKQPNPSTTKPSAPAAKQPRSANAKPPTGDRAPSEAPKPQKEPNGAKASAPETDPAPVTPPADGGSPPPSETPRGDHPSGGNAGDVPGADRGKSDAAPGKAA